jgi:hypothetical protein
MCQVGLTECVDVAASSKALELQLNNVTEESKRILNQRDFRSTCVTFVL